MNPMIHRAIVNSLEKLVVGEGGDWHELLVHIATGLDQPGVLWDRRFKVGSSVTSFRELSREEIDRRSRMTGVLFSQLGLDNRWNWYKKTFNDHEYHSDRMMSEQTADFIGYFKGELKREIIENPTEASLQDHESSSHIIQFTGNLTWRTLIEYLRFLKDETSSSSSFRLSGTDQIIRARTIMNEIDLPDMFNNERNLQVTQHVDPAIN
jgi:hypothetical protein